MISFFERLDKYMKYKGLNDNKITVEAKISNGLIGKARKRGSLSQENISKILHTYEDLDAKWLLTGIGEMLKKSEKLDKIDEATPIIDKNIVQIPLVGQYAYAGYLSGFSDPEYLENLPTVPIFVDRELKGNYLSFEVRGDSMEDGTDNSIKEGDILISREIKQEYWKYKLHINKWYFIIVHKTEGILIKKIIKHDVEKGVIRIHSLNTIYKDLDLNLSEISQLFNVVQVFRKLKL